jgi:flavin reductase (DIM6/NTAB) family NADH-FMN oxidoreductase RutF
MLVPHDAWMFYEPRSGHGLPHSPFNALVVPRPIGWISTVSTSGDVNLAPYSFFNGVAYTPPQVMFSMTEIHADGSGHRKDSMRNALETGEFVVNIATWALRDQLNLTSTPAPHGIDEFDVAGLTRAECHLVAAPRIAESPASLECRVVTHVELRSPTPGTPPTLVIGEVVGVHIADHVLVDGSVDYTRLDAIGRLGYRDYVHVTEHFSMTRPGWPITR